MDYRILCLEPDAEAHLQRLLIAMTLFLSLPLKPQGEVGYGFDVEDQSLRSMLSYLDWKPNRRFDSVGPSLLRLYASFEEETATALIVGDDLSLFDLWADKKFPHSDRLEGGSLVDGIPEKQWGLIGMSLPGWMVLFDNETFFPTQDKMGRDFRALYLPLETEDLEVFEPQATSLEVALFLVDFLAQSLPLRSQGREDL